MVNKNLTYIAQNAAVIAAEGNYVTDFNINQFSRRFSLKSITFNYSFLITGLNLNYNYYTSQDQYCYLLVGSLIPANILGSFFDNVTVPFVNGTGFQIITPGNYHWEQFFINQTLPLEVYCMNNDLINACTFSWSLIIEIETYDR